MKRATKQAAKPAPKEDLPGVVAPEVVVGENQIGVDESPDVTPVITAEENQRRANRAHHSERYSAPKK